ncbi:MAG: glycosyltransferase family 2 protein [Bacteroidales bacterium]
MTVKILFWLLTGIILYTYFGYTVILMIINLLRRMIQTRGTIVKIDELPEISLVIAAYNEKDIISAKMSNIESLDYPGEKLKVIWVTDGSDDGSVELLKRFENITLLHQEKREGKSAAINRAMKKVSTPVTVLSDANTMLNREALIKVAEGFADGKVGCVAGEKRIYQARAANAANAGEGSYWRYESMIKRLESGTGSAIGGAGELIAFRTSLFKDIPPGIINDDFTISLDIIRQGYRVKYCPEAFATEKGSRNMREETRRKVRISSGGIQILARNLDILNIFRYGFYTFQYISHKVLRWTVVPLSIIPVFIVNILIILKGDSPADIYLITFWLQSIFYLLVVTGGLLSNLAVRIKLIFLPYYLFSMNHATIVGIIRYLSGGASPLWERSGRMT